MPLEHISPELVLVDPDLAVRAREALATPTAPSRTSTPPSAPAPASRTTAPAGEHERRYPIWARVTAALWLLVLGILIGGAAIPHAQDKPRVIPPDDEAVVTVCKPASALPPLRGHLGGG